MTIYNIKNNEYEYNRINLNLKSIGEKCFIESLDFNKSNQSFEIHHNRFELLMNNYISDLKMDISILSSLMYLKIKR